VFYDANVDMGVLLVSHATDFAAAAVTAGSGVLCACTIVVVVL
jgi:hypothetical protein